MVVWATLVVAVGVGVVDLALGLRQQARVIDRNAAAEPAGRNAGGAMSIDIDRGFVAAALAYASHDGTYAIETGPDCRGLDALDPPLSPDVPAGPAATRPPRRPGPRALAPLLRL